jgi:hypothetical protein
MPLTPSALAVLGEGGVVRHVAAEVERAQSPISQVEMGLLAERPFRALYHNSRIPAFDGGRIGSCLA